ncbi:hypothetical protein H8A99_38690 [Bradyrhizobium sp. Arg68]|uniref:hypothetical protein n=1 Tax=Bradyrhizobium ivorense TaxID=2511166 RepID=UPI001E48F04B|nr:hypothetical protein [Bradyrhizobium ivorense]MCC8942183.1 hypothetical protein [Bradyrhizobium ivorense]
MSKNNPMQSSSRSPARRLDASGKSLVFFHYSEVAQASTSPRFARKSKAGGDLLSQQERSARLTPIPTFPLKGEGEDNCATLHPG